MATIKAIESRSVHQIQSGQVIVDLNSVVKELVENSLDAGATSIDIRFKNQGLDAIEVQDNGKGIAPDDFETVALKHHTSKLSAYDDLTTLETFGFRGEALSSLCALSKFHILTARAEDGALGKKLEFDVSGELKRTSPCAAQRGTTVFVEDIFNNLPVRRKELEKNIKREYGKVIALLYQYACISVGVRFSVSNQMSRGKRVAVFSTKSNTTTKENITNLFGAKTLLALSELDLHLQMQPAGGRSIQSSRNRLAQTTDRSLQVHVQGHISKPVFGEGRQAPDRQMFFINSRPCQLPQVSKAINEVYKSFNVSQSPFIFANLVMETNSYDVNVSPDKRTIMLHDQTALLESLKTALTDMFDQIDHTVPQSSLLPDGKLPAYQPLSIARKASTIEDSQSKDRSRSADADEDSDSELEDAGSKRGSTNLIHDWVGRDSIDRFPSHFGRKPSVGKTIKRESVALEEVGQGTPLPAHFDPPIDVVNNPDPFSTPFADLSSQRLTPVDHAAETTQGSSDDRSASVHSDDAADDEDEQGEAPALSHMQSRPVEPAIPAFTPGSYKTAPGPIQNAFDRMRPQRTSQQTAQITVGDVTTTTVIGSNPIFKKRRVHTPKNSQGVANFGAHSGLAQGLRNFAAPGSQLHLDSRSEFITNRRVTGSDVSEPDDDSEDETDGLFVRQGGAEAEQLRGGRDAPFVEYDTTKWIERHNISDPPDDLAPAPTNDDDWDDDYIDEEEKKAREEEKIATLIREVEEASVRPTEQNLKRAEQALKNGHSRRESPLKLVRSLSISTAHIEKTVAAFGTCRTDHDQYSHKINTVVKDDLDDTAAENKLSLTVTKADFGRMQILGQFNLGFILAVRPGAGTEDEDDLFIIDQHAADEKYNYERLQRTVTLQSQRMVRPKALELTASQEEIIINHTDALKANGFEIESTGSFALLAPDDEDVGASKRQLRLLTLPMSKEKTFDLSDLEELIHLLSEQPAGSSEIPRPKKVQRMLAMRACRSSIMVGKTLTLRQMEKVVRHMGEMEKPWNCPHGRPTMRHLAGLAQWRGWSEGQETETTDWEGWLEGRQNCSEG